MGQEFLTFCRMTRTLCGSVRPSVHYQLVKNAHKILNHIVYFDQVLYIDACQHYLPIDMCNSLF